MSLYIVGPGGAFPPLRERRGYSVCVFARYLRHPCILRLCVNLNARRGESFCSRAQAQAQLRETHVVQVRVQGYFEYPCIAESNVLVGTDQSCRAAC